MKERFVQEFVSMEVKVIQICKQILKKVDKVKSLGVIIDDKLNWNHTLTMLHNNLTLVL